MLISGTLTRRLDLREDARRAPTSYILRCMEQRPTSLGFFGVSSRLQGLSGVEAEAKEVCECRELRELRLGFFSALTSSLPLS